MVKRLKAPTGADEANFGTERFRVDNDGTVEVPDEAVASLTGVAGFTADPEPVAVPEGMVRMLHDDSGAQVSVGGVSFSAGEDGTFLVPLRAVRDLAAHGFTVAPDLGDAVQNLGSEV